jgi:TPR repeat protein
LQLDKQTQSSLVKEDKTDAAHLKAEEKKVPISNALKMVLAGEEYYYGLSGKKQDDVAAYALFNSALQQSDDQRAVAWARYYKGTMRAKGYGVTADFGEANELLKAAVRQKIDPLVVSKAALQLGQLYYSAGDKQNARDNRLLSASHSCFLRVIENPPDEDGLAEAYFQIGMQYEHGDGVQKSDVRAVMHYQNAAAVSQSLAYSSAARICLCDFAYSGKVLPKNYKLALSYCEQVIKHSEDHWYRIKAKLRRGVLYAEGDYGIRRNLELARKDLTEVAQQTDDLDSATKAKNELKRIDVQGIQNKDKND